MEEGMVRHYRRPPLGVTPQWVWREKRIHELVDAIQRYSEWEPDSEYQSGYMVRSINEWSAEIELHRSWLNKWRDDNKGG